MGLYRKLQIALILFLSLPGCSKIPSSEGIQGVQSLDELAQLRSEAETGWALDALAIPYIKDEKIKERVAQIHWCGTPVLEYLASNERPSDDVLIARAANGV
jgi:uncharacterized protein YceK